MPGIWNVAPKPRPPRLELACANDDRQTAARARVVELRVTMDRSTGEADQVSLNAAAKPVLDELEALGDDEGLAAVLLHLGHVNQDRYEQASAYLERAMAVAERAGDRRTAAHAAEFLGSIMVFGPVPAAEGIERCRALRRQFADQAGTSAVLLRHEAVLHAMQGRIEEARALHAEAVRAIDELGSPWLSASTVFGQWVLEMLAGAPERAEASARAGLALLQEMGATNQGSTAAAMLAYALAVQGRHDEALRYADLAAAWAAPDDTASQVPQLAARAHVLAARGELERAEAAAREAVRALRALRRTIPTRRRARRSRRRPGTRRPPRRGGHRAARRHQPLRAQGQHRLRSPHTPDARQPRTQGARHEDVASPMHRLPRGAADWRMPDAFVLR